MNLKVFFAAGFLTTRLCRLWQISYKAINAGYRRLDCACDYANEEEVGQGIAKAIADGLCTRDDLFVTSKLWYVTKTSSKHREYLPQQRNL